MKKYITWLGFLFFAFVGVAFAAPAFTYMRSILPETNDRFYIGTSSPSLMEYNGIFVKDITISGTCTGCGTPAGGTWATTSSNYWYSTLNPWSTTSADYWETTQPARGASTTILQDANTWSTLGTTTFMGSILMDSHVSQFTTHNVHAHASDGVFITNLSGQNVALFGAGGGQGVTFYNGVNITGQTTLATSLNGVAFLTNGVVSAMATSTLLISSDDTPEGVTNVYFTNARAQSALSGLYEVPLTFNYPLTRSVNAISFPATSTLYAGVNGQVLTFLNGAWATNATTTFSAPLVFANGNVTCTSASTGVTGCLTGTDWDTFNGKQATLVSGTNIKTINGTTLLGSGDLVVGGVAPFPSNATTTTLSFQQLSFTYATGTGLYLTGSSTINWLNSASSTAGAFQFTNATGSRLSLFSGACNSSVQKPVVDVNGTWSCGTDTGGSGSGASFAWTTFSYFATSTSATTTALTVPAIFASSTSYINTLISQTFGIASSTPWGRLSVVDNLPTPAIVIATSSSVTPYFFVDATTSDMWKDWGRVTIGQPSAWQVTAMNNDTELDPLNVARINTGDWEYLKCVAGGAKKNVQVTTDITTTVMTVALGLPCDDFSFIEDANGVADGVVTSGSQYLRLRPGATGAVTVAGDGMGVAILQAFMNVATNTPSYEAVAKLGGMQYASTSQYVMGFSSATGLAPDYATVPQAGVFFNASSSAADGKWWYVCTTGTATSSGTTGVATSTVTTGDSQNFMRFRIDVNGTLAIFRIQQSDSAAMLEVGRCTTNIPTSNVAVKLLNPQASVGQTKAASNASELHLKSIRAWYRDPMW